MRGVTKSHGGGKMSLIEKLEMPENIKEYGNIPAPKITAARPEITAVKPQVDNLGDGSRKPGSKDADDNGGTVLNKGRKLSKETLDSAFAEMNSKLKMQRTRCEYNYDDATNRVSIKVYNEDTDELVIESPPEESMEAFKKTLELAGIIVDKKS